MFAEFVVTVWDNAIEQEIKRLLPLFQNTNEERACPKVKINS